MTSPEREAEADLVARVAEAASMTLELDELLAIVHELTVPGLADLVGIHLPTAAGLARYEPAFSAPDPPFPQRSGLARRLRSDEAMPFDTALPAVRAFASGAPVLVDDVAALPDVADVHRVRAKGGTTGLVVPLTVGRQVLGTLALARRAGRPQLSPAEVDLAGRVGARIAVAVAHAQRFDRERLHTEALQRALLPARLAQVPGVALAARYVPGADDVEVGGDWYDVFPQSGGRLGLVVGDVMGRGVRAAAVMGQLRAALRAYARLDLPPARTLALLDDLVRELDDMTIATAVYGVLDPVRRTLTYARGGHPPPVLLDGARRGRTLEHEVGPPLGTGGTAQEVTVGLPDGALLALYTDGLVEDRRHDVDHGLDALVAALATGPDDLEQLADHVLAALGRADGHDDDVALLLVRLLDRPTGGVGR